MLAGKGAEDIRTYVTNVTESPWMLRTAIHHPTILLTNIIEPIVALGDTPALHLTISAFRNILGAQNDLDASDFGENLEQIFKNTNEFSMNLCRINLRLVLEYSRLSNIAVGEKSGELVERIIASVVGQGQSGKSVELVKSLNVESKQLVCSQLEYCLTFSYGITWKNRFWRLRRYRLELCPTARIRRYGLVRRFRRRPSWSRLRLRVLRRKRCRLWTRGQ